MTRVWPTVVLAVRERRDEMRTMKNSLIIFCLLACVGFVMGTMEVSLADELGDINNRLEALEQKVQQQEESVSAIADRISIGGGITGVVQGTVKNENNYPAGERGEEVQDGSFSADMEVSAALDDTDEAFLLIETADGAGITDEVTTFFGVNDDASDDDSAVAVTEAWYEHRSEEGDVAFTVGKVDLTNYFDGNAVANDETAQFLSTGLVNNLAIEFPDDNGAGARLEWSGESAYLGIGWGEADADWEDVGDDGFGILEIGYTPTFGDDDLEGTYRIIGWYNAVDHTEILDTGVNPAKTRKANSGYAISLDQQVTEDVTIFGRYGAQDDDVAELGANWSAGLQIQLDDNVFAAAYGQALLGKDYRDFLRASGIHPDNEGFFEAYYSIAVNDLLTLSPDVQVIFDGGGDNSNHTVTVVGIRGQVGF